MQDHIKIMKAIIKIEQFDNGISLKWSNSDHDNRKIIALDFDKEKTIGKMIWDDIKDVMDTELFNEVEMVIEYKAVKEN